MVRTRAPPSHLEVPWWNQTWYLACLTACQTISRTTTTLAGDENKPRRSRCMPWFCSNFSFLQPLLYPSVSLCILHCPCFCISKHTHIYIWMWTIFRWISISIYIHPFFAGLIVFLSYSSSNARRRDDLGVTRNTPQRISRISDIGYQRISREYLGMTRNPQRISRISDIRYQISDIGYQRISRGD